MKKEHLIKKWLDNDLTNNELEAFKKLDDYDSLIKISNHFNSQKRIPFNTKHELNKLLNSIEQKKTTSSKKWFAYVLKTAAVLLLCIGLYQLTIKNNETTLLTKVAQKNKINLPDNSNVKINAASSLTFDKKNWENNRTVFLKGEAFFDVSKGSTFNVNTTHGIITVYGTEFNVKARKNYFEVICYEGLVGVNYKKNEIKLSPGNTFTVIKGKIISSENKAIKQPHWLNNNSKFKSIPLYEVIAEFERQYNVKVIPNDIDLNALFTGGFPHNNQKTAINAIITPLKLSYSKKGNTIILKRD